MAMPPFWVRLGSILPFQSATMSSGGGAASASSHDVKSSSSSMLDRAFALTLAIYTLLFSFFRLPEIALCVMTHTSHSLSTIIGTLVLHYYSPRRARYALHISTLVGVVYICDYSLLRPPPLVPSASRRTIVITGANAGIGYATSRRLAVEYGMHVIMGCRSQVKCKEAADSINMELRSAKSASAATATMEGGGSVTPMLIDLSNFDSIQSFVSTLLSSAQQKNDEQQQRTNHIDVLFNNAGYVPTVNDPINTSYDMESSFASMHMGHFYLTELLVKHNPNLHVVNTSSGTHHLCGILVSKTNGCIDERFFVRGIHSPSDEYAYIRAKLANVLHVMELPMVHARVTAIAIDLGWVGTSIRPWMKGDHLLPSPSSLGMMRSAYIGVTPIIAAILSSSNDELSTGIIGRRDIKGGNGGGGGGVSMNVLGRLEESFSLPWWDKDAMIHVSKRLWDESVKVLSLHGHDIGGGKDVAMNDGVSEESAIVAANNDDDASTPPVAIDDTPPPPPLINAHAAGRNGDMAALTAIGATDVGLLNIKDANGWTPLHEAARGGHLEAVKFLIEHGLDKVIKIQGTQNNHVCLF